MRHKLATRRQETHPFKKLFGNYLAILGNNTGVPSQKVKHEKLLQQSRNAWAEIEEVIWGIILNTKVMVFYLLLQLQEQWNCDWSRVRAICHPLLYVTLFPLISTSDFQRCESSKQPQQTHSLILQLPKTEQFLSWQLLIKTCHPWFYSSLKGLQAEMVKSASSLPHGLSSWCNRRDWGGGAIISPVLKQRKVDSIIPKALRIGHF